MNLGHTNLSRVPNFGYNLMENRANTNPWQSEKKEKNNNNETKHSMESKNWNNHKIFHYFLVLLLLL